MAVTIYVTNINTISDAASVLHCDFMRTHAHTQYIRKLPITGIITCKCAETGITVRVTLSPVILLHNDRNSSVLAPRRIKAKIRPRTSLQ